MHIFEEASPTIIGQMVTPKNIGDFFLESSYYFYCWDDLMELEYGQCVRNKKKYYFISEFAEAIMKRGFFCDKPLYAEFTEEQIQKYFSGEYSVGQIFALAISQALDFTPEQVEVLEDKNLKCLAVWILYDMVLGTDVRDIREILNKPIFIEEKEKQIRNLHGKRHYLLISQENWKMVTEWNAWNKCADDGTLNCIKNLRGNFLCSDAVMDDDYNLIDTNENRYLSI